MFISRVHPFDQEKKQLHKNRKIRFGVLVIEYVEHRVYRMFRPLPTLCPLRVLPNQMKTKRMYRQRHQSHLKKKKHELFINYGEN
jgi:hypothetical protein